MKDLMRGLKAPVVALFALAGLLVFASAAVASQSPSGGGKAQSSKVRHHRHHAKRGPRGPRGPKGVPGAAGAPGPAGPAGTGLPYSFALAANSPTTPVFEANGLRIEAGCPLGALDLVARPEGGDHNIVEVTAFDNSEGGGLWGATYTNASINERIPMLSGASPIDDFNGLLSLRTLAGQMTTVQWWAMGSTFANQYDCVGGGTVSPH
jgi:hypothetical protein